MMFCITGAGKKALHVVALGGFYPLAVMDGQASQTPNA
jgi:hypothetical protein